MDFEFQLSRGLQALEAALDTNVDLIDNENYLDSICATSRSFLILLMRKKSESLELEYLDDS